MITVIIHYYDYLAKASLALPVDGSTSQPLENGIAPIVKT
jgi:hypothetical protein